MKQAILFIVVAFLIPAGLIAQMAGDVKKEEQKILYRLVIEDLLKSGMIENPAAFGVIDSTCPAVYYGGFPDSINLKYFGFDANNYIDGELFRRNFVSKTMTSELLSTEIITEKGLIRIQKEVYRSCFTTSKQPQIILSEKGFEKLKKLCGTTVYCELSLPFHVNEHTVLIYINFQDGVENDFPNVYLLVEQGNEWVIVARLRSWS